MLVGFDDSAVDEGFLEIGVFGKLGKHLMPDTFLRPSPEPLVHGVPFAEFRRQVAPWRAASGDLQDCFQK